MGDLVMDWTHFSWIGRPILYRWATREALHLHFDIIYVGIEHQTSSPRLPLSLSLLFVLSVISTWKTLISFIQALKICTYTPTNTYKKMLFKSEWHEFIGYFRKSWHLYYVGHFHMRKQYVFPFLLLFFKVSLEFCCFLPIWLAYFCIFVMIYS